MAFQRSYSKVWWGSDNPFPAMSLPTSSSSGAAAPAAAGSSFTSGGYYYSYFGQTSQQQQQQQRQQFNGASGGYHSLDSGYNHRSQAANLSRIQEDDEQNLSKLSWGKRDSPGSLRSQDSGFSDNDESHSTRSLGGRSSKTASPSTKSNSSTRSVSSPTSVRSSSIATPPTVIRRVGKSEFYSPLVNVSRRISFSGSPAAVAAAAAATAATLDSSNEGPEGVEQLGQLVTGTAKKLNFDDAAASTQKRRRRVSRKPTAPLTPTKRRTLLESSDRSEDDEAAVEADGTFGAAARDSEDAVSVAGSDASSRLDELDRTAERNRSRTRIHIAPAYNNETVYLGAATPPTALAYNNETVVLGGCGADSSLQATDRALLSPLKAKQRPYMASTSTPKASPATSPQWHRRASPSCRPAGHEYANPLLNGHSPDLQCWLDDLRRSYEHEVMSTLQTKSIAQEAFKNLTITTNTVAKLIRQLQQRALYLQSDFERAERILAGAQAATLHEALGSAEQLVDNVAEFSKMLERRTVFFGDSRLDRKRYEENIEQIRIITKDTRYSLERQHYISLQSLLDDIHVLKRYLLIALRLVFERMVRVIVQSVEQGRCDLMLRANINMIATLMNIDYEGFASLTDAFVQSEAVRALLIVCLEHKLSSVRALALRALATICCVPAAIAQLGACGGIEIVRDIIQVPGKQQRAGELKRGDIERREAVSLLTQITAAWHGPEHRVDGLKDGAEIIVEGLTQLIAHSSCAQTLLLCAAALNNLSRIEITSHYSIMSNEAIFKLIEAMECRENGVTIFLYEQVAAMLHNMSLNKKCHSHLANGSIINFITSAYQAEFYKSYNSRAESDAQRRTVKAILHTLTHLVHESSLGGQLLEQHRVPAYFRQAMLIGGGEQTQAQAQWPLDSSHSRDISMLARQLLQAQRREREQEPQQVSQLQGSGVGAGAGGVERESGLKFNLTRQESFV